MKNQKIEWLTTFRCAVPSEYEHWFEKQAEKGWLPQKVGQWSSIAMFFQKTTPKKYRYVVDLQARPTSNYRQTYEAFGWEFVGKMASAFVWRKEYQTKRPESFSDIESRNNRNKRFVLAVSFSFAIFLITSLVITVCFGLNYSKLTSGEIVQFIIGGLLSYGFTLYLSTVMLKIWKNRE